MDYKKIKMLAVSNLKAYLIREHDLRVCGMKKVLFGRAPSAWEAELPVMKINVKINVKENWLLNIVHFFEQMTYIYLIQSVN